ncbi:MAG: 50S ribosomal protein L16 [Patescibacteria group bacterium]|nr:50S ribosomal protein L16 [Patescibacteria group bacterium]
MLMPRKVKHRKWHKGRRRRREIATGGTYLSYGHFGLQSKSSAWVTARQLEAARRAVTRELKRGGKLWIRAFPDKPVTMKGTQSTMGSGKGSVDHYVAVVRPGHILFELDGVDETTARRAMLLAAHKLPVSSRFLVKGSSL